MWDRGKERFAERVEPTSDPAGQMSRARNDRDLPDREAGRLESGAIRFGARKIPGVVLAGIEAAAAA